MTTTTISTAYFLALHTEAEDGTPDLTPENTTVFYGSIQGITEASKRETGFDPTGLFDDEAHEVRHGKWVLTITPDHLI